MSKLIDELKKEHAVLAETLNHVRSLGITSEEGQKTLLSARRSFLAHLEKEDRQLYPVLERTAKTDPSLRGSLDVFARDMDEISAAALAFFEKYAKGGSGIEFAKDFGKLYAILTQRIGKEERIIYAKFDQIKG